MEFLVTMEIGLPPDMDSALVAEIREAEAARSAELHASGSIVRIWRIPGRNANAGIWEAEDATDLHALIASLPLFPWLDVTVTPLAEHPVERAAAARPAAAGNGGSRP